MRKFNVGDRVRAVNKDCDLEGCLQVGDTGVVSCNSEGDWVSVISYFEDGTPLSFDVYTSEIELVSESPEDESTQLTSEQLQTMVKAQSDAIARGKRRIDKLENQIEGLIKMVNALQEEQTNMAALPFTLGGSYAD